MWNTLPLIYGGLTAVLRSNYGSIVVTGGGTPGNTESFVTHRNSRILSTENRDAVLRQGTLEGFHMEHPGSLSYWRNPNIMVVYPRKIRRTLRKELTRPRKYAIVKL